MSEERREGQYAQVIIDRVSDAVDRPFQYKIPDHLGNHVRVGRQVLVPFRAGTINAFVVDVDQHPVVQESKSILSLLENEPELSEEMIALSYWLSRRFFTRWSEAIRLCLPPAGKRVKKKYTEFVISLVDEGTLLEAAGDMKKKAFRQAFILECLAATAEKGIAWSALQKRSGASRQSLVSLVKKGLVKTVANPCERSPWLDVSPGKEEDLKSRILTGEQEKAWVEIDKALRNPARDVLLHGITGSGKTELYFKAVEQVIHKGRQAIILVPEIALTPHMIEQLRSRFPGQVGMLHSGLSDGERYDQWWKIRERKVNVVLGSRSAIFAPLHNIGLIVMDEEHENTYRQNDSPRYHARDVARWRARYHSALLLLGSATPSLESYLEAEEGPTKKLVLKNRVAGRSLPTMEVVDMREERRYRKRSVFSQSLYHRVKRALARGQQVILFLNRRGFAGIELCRQCGFVVECPHCSVSMTYHTYPEHLQCHYCAYKTAPYHECPHCHSTSIGNFGLGTQKLEKQVKEAFPGAEVIRMDSDVTTGKGIHEKMWRTFKEKKASILVGTQMIAKGHDFPDVTLVGVIAADINLHLPDFRAGEKTFQLLTQVAGRAGRGDEEGAVIIQTFSPEHYSISAAVAQDFEAFMVEEIRRRRLLNYPPFADLLIFGCSAQKEQEAVQTAEKLKARLERGLVSGEELLGPSPAPIKRVKGYFRYLLVYKGEDLQEKNSYIRETIWNFRQELAVGIRVTVDFNPIMML